MSASKNKATNSLLKSEKKSLLRFLTLYLVMVSFTIGLLSLFYLQNQEKLMISQQRTMLNTYAYEQTKKLKKLHYNFPENSIYPRDSRFNSAIYDLEYMQIFSLLEDEEIYFDKEMYNSNGYLHYVKGLDDFYLGTRYLIIEIKDDGVWLRNAWKNIVVYGLLFFFLFLLFGLYLAKVFVKPMRDAIVLLDNFISDTTHELNTPLSAILANIEMMDKSVMADKNKTKLERIDIAAKTVSILYKDLTYLTLEHDKQNEDEIIDIKEVITNRTEYFTILLESKKITLLLDLEEASIMMDRRKFIRAIDNLISNAIKYNRRGGELGIILRQGTLTLWDTGIGIDKDKIPFMFDRYLRFNTTEGGFGVGLSIVKKILDEYHISIDIDSKKGRGTRMELRW